MKTFQFMSLGLVLSSIAPIARAQENAPRVPAARAEAGQKAEEEATPAFVPITPRNLATLPDFAEEGAVRALSLGVTRAQLGADVEAQRALLAWVRGGGIAFLHTDAAQLFGYTTVAARPATAAVAGQLFGRARAALSFGAHPLLWGAAARVDANGRASNDANASLVGASAVRTIYYQAQIGDHFVASHPRGIGLLRLADVAGQADTPVYVAAIAPYGRGWAIVTPNYIEPNRGDGNVFAANLLRFAGISTTPGAAASGTDLFVPLAASWIDAAAQSAQNPEFTGTAAIAALDRILAQPAKPSATAPATTAPATTTPATTETLAPLAITFGEANAIRRSLAGDATRARALVMMLRARLALQNSDGAGALAWHNAAIALAPEAAENLILGGVLAAAQGEVRTFASPVRAQLMAAAAVFWTRALAAAPLLQTPAATAGATGARAAGTQPGVPRALVQLWARDAGRSARLLAFEPPLVSVAGDVVIRHYADDASLRLALPSAALVSQSADSLGLAAENEELVLFPSQESLAAYRAGLGLTAPDAPAPGGVYGDVAGSRMLMVSQPTIRIFLPPLRPGAAPRPFQLGNALPSTVARLHSQVLINSIAADGTPVPAWMQLGLAGLTDVVVTAGGQAPRLDPNLRIVADVGALLGPADFQERTENGEGAQTGLADAQSLRLMQFFYERFGAGAVGETLQRLGAGQTADAAIRATTGLTEREFFRAWSDAEFGN